MGVLRGLSGVKAKEVECFFIENLSDLDNKLSKTMAATAAGDNGAINIWVDDAGNIRCEAMQYLRQVDYKEYKKLSGAKRWVEKWLKKID